MIMVHNLFFYDSKYINIVFELVLQWCTDAVSTQAAGSCDQRFVITAPHCNICSAVSALPLRNSLRQSMLEPDNFSNKDAGGRDAVNSEKSRFLITFKRIKLMSNTHVRKARRTSILSNNKIERSNQFLPQTHRVHEHGKNP